VLSILLTLAGVRVRVYGTTVAEYATAGLRAVDPDQPAQCVRVRVLGVQRMENGTVIYDGHLSLVPVAILLSSTGRRACACVNGRRFHDLLVGPVPSILSHTGRCVRACVDMNGRGGDGWLVTVLSILPHRRCVCVCVRVYEQRVADGDLLAGLRCRSRAQHWQVCVRVCVCV
jgi:hypothetical protein